MFTEGALIELAIKGIGGLFALLAAIGLWVFGRHSGRNAAERKQAQATIKQADKNRRTRHDADRDARNDDDPARSLRDKWSRD